MMCASCSGRTPSPSEASFFHQKVDIIHPQRIQLGVRPVDEEKEATEGAIYSTEGNR